MSSSGDSIVNKKLKHDTFSSFATIRDVLSTSFEPFSIPLTPFGRSRAISSAVASNALRTRVFAVILTS
jgi:hypothetical protein